MHRNFLRNALQIGEIGNEAWVGQADAPRQAVKLYICKTGEQKAWVNIVCERLYKRPAFSQSMLLSGRLLLPQTHTTEPLQPFHMYCSACSRLKKKKKKIAHQMY